MRAVAILLLLCGLVAAQQIPLFAPGRPVPQLHLQSSSGTPIQLQTLTENAPVLLLFLPAQSSPCPFVADAASLRAEAHIDIVITHAKEGPGQTPCSTPQGVHIAQTTTPASTGPAQAIIVDDSLYIRWRADLVPGVAGWQALQDGVQQWLQGRQVYEVNCGHCHGFDGRSASSPDVNPLAGISRKYHDAKILELGSLFGGVDMTGWSPAKRAALLLYLRGL